EATAFGEHSRAPHSAALIDPDGPARILSPMGWDDVATSEVVDPAERAVLAALSRWTAHDDETFGRELAVVFAEIADQDVLRNSVLTCAITLSALALTEVREATPQISGTERRTVRANQTLRHSNRVNAPDMALLTGSRDRRRWRARRARSRGDDRACHRG